MTNSPVILPKGLNHIAVIMDGNGRWAEQRHRERVYGHKHGSDAVKVLVETCAQSGLSYLSLFAFSTENWDRPEKEVNALMKLFVEFLRQQSSNIIKNNIKFMVTGEFERLPVNVQKLANELIKRTEQNKGMTLNLAVSYGGKQDILQAVKKIASEVKEGKISSQDISLELIDANLWTKGIPEPDLLIRTSGESRLSNFMIWQTAYTEIYITEALWPDFDRQELIKALDDFAGRKRRFGKVEN